MKPKEAIFEKEPKATNDDKLRRPIYKDYKNYDWLTTNITYTEKDVNELFKFVK